MIIIWLSKQFDRMNEDTPLLLRPDSPEYVGPRYKKQKSSWFCTFYQLCIFILLLFLVVFVAFSLIWAFRPASEANEGNSIVRKNATSRNGNYTRRRLNNLLLIALPLPGVEENSSDVSAPWLDSVNNAIQSGYARLKERRTRERREGDGIKLDSPSGRHQHSIVNTQAGNRIAQFGYVENEATKALRNEGVRDVLSLKSDTNLKWMNDSGCARTLRRATCVASKYRTVNGECNNLEHPRTWGVAMTPFRRTLPPDYEDGVSVPRGGFTGGSLPNARDVSVNVHRPVYRADTEFTVMLAVWGQFIDHDITATALSRGPNGSSISCCPPPPSATTTAPHPECFPVLLHRGDNYYDQFNVTCMEFVRSAPALRCSFGPRDQLNQASSYLDGSVVYGNTDELAAQLRVFKNGALDMSYTSDGRALLPFSPDPRDGCNQQEEMKKGRYCFLAGDSRANENTHLTTMHVIFARHHNSLALTLHSLNPHWDDEKLYQESRKILSAQLQHITYSEFLPILLGRELCDKLTLSPLKLGFWKGYNKSLDASIANVFAAAAFRFAHTLIPGIMKRVAGDFSSPQYFEMREMLFNPYGLYEGQMDSYIRGASRTNIERSDNYFTEQLTEHLFERFDKTNNTACGLDLVALNIQRGRDHGLPSYIHWRKLCGLSVPKSVADLRQIFDTNSANIISKLYKNIEDIDVYSGMLSEMPPPGGILGATLTCLISDQFLRLKFGDRYWYETADKPQAFSRDQLQQIRNTSLASILCQNGDKLNATQPYVMRAESRENTRTSCHLLPKLDMNYWKESSSDNTNYIAISAAASVDDDTGSASSNVDTSSAGTDDGTSGTSGNVGTSTASTDGIISRNISTSNGKDSIENIFGSRTESNSTSANNYGLFLKADATKLRFSYPGFQQNWETDKNNSIKVLIPADVLEEFNFENNSLRWNGSIIVSENESTINIRGVFPRKEKFSAIFEIRLRFYDEIDLIARINSSEKSWTTKIYTAENKLEVYKIFDLKSEKSWDSANEKIKVSTKMNEILDKISMGSNPIIDGSVDTNSSFNSTKNENYDISRNNQNEENFGKFSKNEKSFNVIMYGKKLSDGSFLWYGNITIYFPIIRENSPKHRIPERNIITENESTDDILEEENSMSINNKEKIPETFDEKFGEFMGTVLNASLFSRLPEGEILPWWSEGLPSKINIPISELEIFNLTMEWKYTPFGNFLGIGNFSDFYINPEVSLLGNFTFSYKSLASHAPFLDTECTILSPILFSDKDIFDPVPADPKTRKTEYFAPLILLGNYSDDGKDFAWNTNFAISFFNPNILRVYGNLENL